MYVRDTSWNGIPSLVTFKNQGGIEIKYDLILNIDVARYYHLVIHYIASKLEI